MANDQIIFIASGHIHTKTIPRLGLTSNQIYWNNNEIQKKNGKMCIR